jgi:hypothetical protein
MDNIVKVKNDTFQPCHNLFQSNSIRKLKMNQCQTLKLNYCEDFQAFVNPTFDDNDLTYISMTLLTEQSIQ